MNKNHPPSFKLIYKCQSEKKAEIIYKSILLEHDETQIRSKCNMELKGDIIIINCISDDISILKASIYSYLRWIKVAESIYKLTVK